MGCLKLNDEIYEGVVIDMGNKKKNNNSNNKSFQKIELYITILMWLVGISLPLLGIYVGWSAKTIHNVDKNALTKEDIKKLEDDVAEINLWIQGDINDKNKPGANYRLNEIEKKINIASISISNNNIEFVNFVSETNENEEPKDSPNFETYLGEDTEGNKYNFGDVINETILLTYNEEGKEVYFLGQLNENYHWHGYCVTNTYNADGTLYGICESNFNDGNRIDYKSFYESDTNNEWILTNRKCTNEGNLGTSICYNFEYDKIKNFTNTNVRVYDILYVDDFNNPEGKTMIYYYNGLTSDGAYNDQRENTDAYRVSFNSDGTVKTLYIGKFKNGDFHDENATEIVFDDTEGINRYFSITCEFEGGERKGSVSAENYVTQEQIDKILSESGRKFDVELKWYSTE